MEKMAAVKISPQPSEQSSASSPESTLQFPTSQKRKGGRKPVYATQEERKMRNRAAQAAFRERRTEYIKHLEATIKHHEEALATLQQSSRNAADEVLMLRYKTSLLERILLEKGIDVHAELRAFAQSEPVAPPMTPVMSPTASQQRRPLQQQQIHMPRQQVKRSSVSHQAPALYMKTTRELPASRTSSPPANSSCLPTPPDHNGCYVSQSVASTPSPEYLSHQNNHNNGCVPMPNNYYPSPYPAHMEELEQEYEAELLENQNASPGGINSPPSSHPNGNGSIAGNGNLDVMSTIGMSIQANSPSSTVGAVPQQGLYNVGTPLESPDQFIVTNLNHLTGSSMLQFNIPPFGFATSNLR